MAKVLTEQVFSRFGVPVSLLSDQGKEVDGSIMKAPSIFQRSALINFEPHPIGHQQKWSVSTERSTRSLERPRPNTNGIGSLVFRSLWPHRPTDAVNTNQPVIHRIC